MTTTTDAAEADRALKAKHRAMWASGNYAACAAEVIPGLGATLVDAVKVSAGDRVLDVAAGTGNAAIPAALAGARVTATDLTPELLDIGRELAAQRGEQLNWEPADAEALPYGDGSFDVVLSCVGVMFAPHHQASADELVRVCRPGGRIGLLSWTPEGFVGQMFRAMKPYAAAPAPGAQPPSLWGNEEHLRTLFGERVTGFKARRVILRIDRFPTADAFRDFFKANYGPTISVYRNIAEEPERVAALDRELVDLAHRHDLGGGAMDWEYLLATAYRT
jgi:ubiquinone/menaquinone biosynthesis C-methylase UbiE